MPGELRLTLHQGLSSFNTGTVLILSFGTGTGSLVFINHLAPVQFPSIDTSYYHYSAPVLFPFITFILYHHTAPVHLAPLFIISILHSTGTSLLPSLVSRLVSYRLRHLSPVRGLTFLRQYGGPLGQQCLATYY